MHGTARLIGPDGESAPEHANAVRLLRAKYAQYATHALETRPMIRIEIERATELVRDDVIDSVNFIDLLALLIIGVAIYFGWRSGFVIQASGAGRASSSGIAVVIVAAPAAANALRRRRSVAAQRDRHLRDRGHRARRPGDRQHRRRGACAGAWATGIVGGVDTGAGAAFGLVRGLFLVWLMGGLAAALPMAGVATEARQSADRAARSTRGCRRPSMLAAQLGRLIESTGLPEVFVGAPPPADIPDGGPTQAEAEQIAAAARASTLRVEAVACGNFVSGTAFAVSTDHFVTNAHVVAGSTDVWLSFDGSLDRYDAQVVVLRSGARRRGAGRRPAARRHATDVEHDAARRGARMPRRWATPAAAGCA